MPTQVCRFIYVRDDFCKRQTRFGWSRPRTTYPPLRSHKVQFDSRQVLKATHSFRRRIQWSLRYSRTLNGWWSPNIFRFRCSCCARRNRRNLHKNVWRQIGVNIVHTTVSSVRSTDQTGLFQRKTRGIRWRGVVVIGTCWHTDCRRHQTSERMLHSRHSPCTGCSNAGCYKEKEHHREITPQRRLV